MDIDAYFAGFEEARGFYDLLLAQYDVFKSPLEDFQRAVRQAGWEDRVRYLTHGEWYNW